jgi:hypothetical protein
LKQERDLAQGFDHSHPFRTHALLAFHPDVIPNTRSRFRIREAGGAKLLRVKLTNSGWISGYIARRIPPKTPPDL